MKLKSNKFIQEWVMPIAVAGVVYLVLTRLIFFNVIVPTPSMVPTIDVGDRMFTTHIYNFENLKLGDIIVFENKEENDDRLVKRLIGLPNEEIKIERDGTIYVDGVKLEEDYVKNQVDKNGKYPLMKIGTFKVPKDAYFFLGDNRSNSRDARYWDDPYVYEEELISKVRFRFWPLSNFGKVD